MAKLTLRAKALGALLKRLPVPHGSHEQILAFQARQGNPDPLTKFLTGALVSGVDVVNTRVAGGAETIPARVYRPANEPRTLPIVVLIHGGGWAAGTPAGYDWISSSIARDAHVVVISLDYRLAPRDKWPAAPEDCYSALRDIAARAERWGADASRLALVGDSAGGNLVAAVTLMAKDRSGPSIALQCLLYPVLDLTLSSESVEENTNAPILDKSALIAYRDLYVAAEERRHPYASPLLAADHTSLPPALIQVAEYDPLRDDGLRYAPCWRRVRSRCEPPPTSVSLTATSTSRASAASRRKHSARSRRPYVALCMPRPTRSEVVPRRPAPPVGYS